MKKIAVSGGKGGTGKSSFAVLLTQKYLRANQKVLLVDLDVECPNVHLLVNQKLLVPFAKISLSYPEIQSEKCSGCGKCVNLCRFGALFQAGKEKVQTLIQLNCSRCGLCEEVCPQDAIAKKEEQVGEIYKKEIRKNLVLITGKAKIGVKDTAVVVEKTIAFCQKYLENNFFDIVIFDLPAGTHCNVIKGILAADEVFAVTEPTPLGAHDLDLILKLGKYLSLPMKVVLNKSNLGEKKVIKELLKRYQEKISLEIPYLSEIEKRYAQGNLFKIGYKI